MRFAAFILLATSACLSGCGVPGAPQPPSLGIPKAINDLQAARKGNTVTLTWTEPTETTDGELIRKLGKMVVTRSASQGGSFQSITELPLQPALTEKQRAKASATDNIATLIADPAAPDFLFYRVTSVSHRDTTSLPSNLVSVPTVITPPPPQSVTLGLTPRGVSITFDVPQMAGPIRLNSQPIYRILRREENAGAAAQPSVAGEFRPGSQGLPVIDSRIEWEKKYDYWVRPVTLWHSGSQNGEIEGDDSPTATIIAHDTFPPAAPLGLQAVFSGLVQRPAIDLTWTPNTEDDLAGYNVYRHTASAPPMKINSELVKTPAFHDANVTLGENYFYTVTAVDLRGNESPRSAETSETVPRE
jgi:hypothetical protein